MSNPDLPPARWVSETEANRPNSIDLPILANELRTPAQARHLAVELKALIAAFRKRNNKSDEPVLFAVIELAAAVKHHADALERWHEAQAAEFAAGLEDGLPDE